MEHERVVSRGGNGASLQSCVCVAAGFSSDESREISSTVLALSGEVAEEFDETVTHVIAKHAGSKAHRLASAAISDLSRDVRIVTRSWIDHCARSQTSAPPGTRQHILPPLLGFRIAVTGYRSQERSDLGDMISKAGAQYSPGLGPGCTHLVAAVPNGAKYEYAVQNEQHGIRIVSADWVRDCVGQWNLLDETRYALATTSPARTVQADIGTAYVGESQLSCVALDAGNKATRGTRRPLNAVVLNKQTLSGIEPSLLMESFILLTVPDGLHEGASARDRRNCVRKLAALTGATLTPRWTPGVTHVVILAVPIGRQHAAELKKAEQGSVDIVSPEWMLACARARTVLPISEHPPPAWLPAGASRSSMDAGVSLPGVDLSNSVGPGLGSQRLSAPPVFQGVRLAIGPLALRNTEAGMALSQEVAARQGKVLVHDAAGRVMSGVPTHVLCGPNLQAGERALVNEMKLRNPLVEPVTERWIRDCMSERQLLAVSSCVLYSALPYDLPIPEFDQQKVRLSISGFMDKPPDPNRNRRRDVLVELAQLLGAEYRDRMRRYTTTHLIVENAQTSKSEKVSCALAWKIPVLSERWLLACASMGRFVSISPYVECIPSRAHTGTPGRKPPVPSIPPGAPSLGLVVHGGDDTGQIVGRKRPQSDLKGDSNPCLSAPRNAAEASHVGPSDPAEKPADTASAEALLRRVAANLEKITDATMAAGVGSQAPGPDRARLSESLSGRRSSPTPGGDDDPSDRSSRDSFAARAEGLLSKGPAGLGQSSDWSLDGSQSQIIVHRDLTPPPAEAVPSKPAPKLRMMPSRAAKSGSDPR